MQKPVTLSLGEDLIEWIDAIRPFSPPPASKSRSSFVEACIRSVQGVIGLQAEAFDSDRARAVQAVESLRAGEVPSRPDNEALAREYRRQREAVE